MRTTVPASGARLLRITAAATAAGFAYSLFLCSYFDPAAIGWPLTPFIGAFWGALLGGLVGLGLRLVAMALTSTATRSEFPVAVIAPVVMLVAVVTSLVLGRFVAVGESAVDARVGAGALLGAGLLPAVLTALATGTSPSRRGRGRSRGRGTTRERHHSYRVEVDQY